MTRECTAPTRGHRAGSARSLKCPGCRDGGYVRVAGRGGTQEWPVGALSSLTAALGSLGWNSRDVVTAFLAAADDLKKESAKHQNLRDWLCEFLTTMADSISGSLLADATEEAIRAALENANCPHWLAKALARRVREILDKVIQMAMPGSASPALVIRLLALAVCVDPRCERSEGNAKVVLDAAEAPDAADQ